MKINRENAFKLWERIYGKKKYARDFHGNLMCRDAYGDPDYFEKRNGKKVYCGWNVHHIQPKAHGGSNRLDNLTLTNIITNEEAADKNTYWIDGIKYQVQRSGESYDIYQLN